ncbi:Ldh family oxidoreductase [Paraburkholderia sp. MMS20-SJTR3]|uniref:Ldh family oxidoreductase n=1 Tax=Paraburkholderia sejongensis TaxID=2886946 RepID=A0ABS8JQZ4_9BURK|nr:Ldh family oxidoreductase [Paraburkholderia sp. MMS20-SJTR3]MCC8392297.1 Ldh family oxidoreductase [Paraburkholderia sp. MMS20-SJTR3]
MNTQIRYSADELQAFAQRLLVRVGMEDVKALAIARTLVDGDLMGHDTHGLALLPAYIGEIENGAMTCSGEPEVVSDRGGSVLWDGRRLPGPWLVLSGIETLAPRAKKYGTATLVIRRSHHIACLASYLERATADGFMIVLSSSDPAGQSVAPHGGTRSVFTPNPIAAGIPASGTPFLIDISSSMVTQGMTARQHKAGQHFDEACFLDADGQPSGDPGVLSADPPGSILPVGGMTGGHKGFGLALLIEALTGGLAGHGRADPADGWGATVFLSLYDPAAFGGLAAFVRQMDWLGDACRDNPPRPGTAGVRMPGDRGLSLKREQLRDGVALHPTIAPALEACARRYDIALPSALPG